MEHQTHVVEFVKGAVKGYPHSRLFREPLVGFSAASDSRYRQIKKTVGEHHAYPEEILPGVKTIISFFVPFAAEIVTSNQKEIWTSESYAASYIHANALINQISEDLICYFRQHRIAAEMIRATHTFDPVTLKASWSHRSAACIAGLGTFGLNRMLITPKGCAGRFGTVFVGESIAEGGSPSEERCLYYKKGKCRYCVCQCPTGALTDNNFDRQRCYKRLLEVDQSFPELDVCDVCGKCLVGPCAILEP